MKKKNKIPRVYSAGQAAMAAVLFFIFISVSIVGAFGQFASSELRQVQTLEQSKRGYLFGEGALEDAVYRVKSAKNMPPVVSYADGDLSATTTTTTTADGINIETRAASTDAYRSMEAALVEGTEAAFNYGVQVGDGGLRLRNTSSVYGNVYSNGPVAGDNSNIIRGDLVSAGVSGLADGVHATGTVYAHTIRNSQVDKDAHYQAISGTTVGGVSYPGSVDQLKKDLAISDATINTWEQAVAASTTCPGDIDGSVTLGPVKITCNLEIEGSADVTLAGTVWITGNLTIKGSPQIHISSALGRKSVAVIVDKTSNRTTSSEIDIQNSPEFGGSGTEGSYILLISQNSSAEGGGNEIAIDAQNNQSRTVNELLIYAPHGSINVQNSIQLREVSGYKIDLRNSASILYRTGLADMLFESGPSGGYRIDSWKEIP